MLFIGRFVAGPFFGQQYKTFPMWDYTLPPAERFSAANTITRLGIPAHGWWNETFHDIARIPYPVTSYPQAIAMAATWDMVSLYLMADIRSLSRVTRQQHSCQPKMDNAGTDKVLSPTMMVR